MDPQRSKPSTRPQPAAIASQQATPPVRPAATVPVSRFGGPIGSPDAVGTARVGPSPPAHRTALTAGPALSKPLLWGLVVAVIASLGIAGFVWSHDSGAAGSAQAGGSRGPAAVAAAKLDALSLASAEETFFSDHQKYLDVAATPGIVVLGAAVVHLSPDDAATVRVDPAGVGYCIAVVSRSGTTGASSTVVYVSTAGGLQPSLVTTCPAAF